MRSGNRHQKVTQGSRGVPELLALAVVVALAAALPATAGNASASLSVSVFVPPRAILSVETAPAGLEITAADVARGYLDVPRATRARVRTNDPGGWLLRFDVAEGPYRSLEVTGLGAPTQVNPTGGWVNRPYPASHVESLELGYRFVLEAGARPGVYAWPVALSAQPR